MNDEPEGLTKPLIAHALREHWRLDLRDLEYAPLGFGSYHWHATEVDGRRWFVTADHLSSASMLHGDDAEANFAGLQAAIETARSLRDAGLEFIVAPIANNAGRVIERLSHDWCLALYPHIEGQSNAFGQWPTDAQRGQASRLIGRLHSAQPPASVQPWDPELANRRILEETFASLDNPWHDGPFSELCRHLLQARRGEIEAWLKRHDALLDPALASRDQWVITHGEPHASNVIASPDGLLHLIDWDTVRLAPRERDLWIVAGNESLALAEYQHAAGPFVPNDDLIELFDLRWTLADTAVYVRRFRSPHNGSADDEMSWRELQSIFS